MAKDIIYSGQKMPQGENNLEIFSSPSVTYLI